FRSDDAFLAQAQHFTEHDVRVAYRLQGLGHHHRVETAGAEVGQAFDVQVLLDHVDSLTDTFGDLGRVDLQPVALHLLVGFQVMQQGAVATAQVQHAGTRRDPLQDYVSAHTHLQLPREPVHIAGAL